MKKKKIDTPIQQDIDYLNNAFIDKMLDGAPEELKKNETFRAIIAIYAYSEISRRILKAWSEKETQN